MAEFFVKGFKRDYVYLADVRTAAKLIADLHVWFDDTTAFTLTRA